MTWLLLAGILLLNSFPQLLLAGIILFALTTLFLSLIHIYDGNLGKQLVKDVHLCIFRTEIVSPL